MSSRVTTSDLERPEAGSVTHSRTTTYFLAVLIAALWGASFVITKSALDYLGPLSIAFVRWAISALAILGWISLRGRLPLAFTLIRQDARHVFWLALTGVTMFYALENLALNFTTAANAGILSNLTTIFMVLIAVIWWGERLRAREWLALGMAFLGAALISQGSGHVSLSGTGLRGDLLMVLATVMGAVYSVDSKRLTRSYPADIVIGLVALVGALMLLPLALREGLNLALPITVWGLLLLLGLGAGALANLWWLHILSYTDASRAGMVLFVVPVFSTVLAVLVLHDPLTLVMALGAGLVLAGVAIMQRKT